MRIFPSVFIIPLLSSAFYHPQTVLHPRSFGPHFIETRTRTSFVVTIFVSSETSSNFNIIFSQHARETTLLSILSNFYPGREKFCRQCVKKKVLDRYMKISDTWNNVEYNLWKNNTILNNDLKRSYCSFRGHYSHRAVF